ncbi:MAG: NADH-ubiquinone oxidoreductase-F iron-sulfur binding region domain-containing protein [Syntrophobacteraceae bacterium]|jgi:NADH-quinone oxidoreductase subunit F
MKVFRSHFLVCGGTGCHLSGSINVRHALEQEIDKRGLSGEVKVVETGCNGLCALGPVIVAYPEGIVYMSAMPEDMPELVEEHLVKGRVLERLLYKEPITKEAIPRMNDIPFFALQKLIVLKNRGVIDPENIDETIARDGYAGMAKALTEMTSEQIIKEVFDSGLRGRGGAGFPTGLKWRFCAQTPGEVKYILCNADEGDPGAFMDRSVLEADPHAVLEGMVIGAKAIGAHQGYIYCRAEYPLALHRLDIAINQAKEYGLLGKDILGTGFDLDIEVYQGAGAFVCGEETALMTSIEGKRGMPRTRPPFPAIAGLWGKPSVLNNVETFASVGQIILNGASWYNAIGTEKSKGTKVFALTGDVVNVGLVEVPMGTTLGQIVYDIGGGIPGGKKFKAAQLGGPSGGCIPIGHLNTPIDYERVTELGAIMGSGGLIVMNEDKCAVDMARFFMDFVKDESCGKCTPCRAGTKRMLDILTDITQGRGKEGDIERLEQMGAIIKNASLCGLGQTAPNPVLSTIRYFRDEYEEHIREKKCRAVVCSALFKSPCQHTCPAGMDVPAYVALVRAERFEDAYKIMLRTNPFPSVCGRVCDHKCQSKCRRSNLDEAIAVKYLKRFVADNAPRPQTAPVPVTRKEKIAVIGAGPAGLTAARDLALRGYKTTVFEELPEPGGMLRWGIPAYRLPRDILAGEINDNIQALGVEIKCNTRVGKEISFEQVDREFDYVFLATGAHQSQPMRVHGENLQGVFGSVEFLRDFNTNEEAWLSGKKTLGSKVAVIGGGNSAIDVARVALRLGADVTILYRREKKDMPAAEEEILAAEDEGVKIQFLVAPLRLEEKDGKVCGITCERMELSEFDKSGRKIPGALEGSAFTLSVDAVVSAIGQVPDMTFVQEDSGVSVSRWSTFELASGSKSQMKNPKFFAGGDALTGPDTVIGAIAAGHQAARDMDGYIRMINGEPAYVEPPEEEIMVPFAIDEESIEASQAKMPELDALRRRRDFEEIELGFERMQAVKEASRCLRCDAEIP